MAAVQSCEVEATIAFLKFYVGTEFRKMCKFVKANLLYELEYKRKCRPRENL
jgi:hypothetical protein